MAPPGIGLAQDLFEDMGRKVDEVSKGDMEDGDTKMVEEIESLCMNCHDDGMTRLLLTKIPFFREVVLMSFACTHCGFKNSEIQSAGEIQQRGVKFTFKPDSGEDLNRQIVKSDSCVLRIEDVDLEIPPGRGQLTNVEGILNMVREDLAGQQTERKEVMPDAYEKIERILEALSEILNGARFPMTISLDDAAGNSWIEPSPQDKAGKYSRHDYARSAAQNAALGLADGEEEPPSQELRPEYHPTQMYPVMPAESTSNNVDEDDILENQVYSFPTDCPGCTRPGTTNMKMVNIPHFKQVVIMSTVCDHCGYRSNEVKTGGEVPENGRRITVSVEQPEDLSRDILKSESCAMECPELHLSVQPGTLGGRFTTIEGILAQMRDDLRASIFDTDDDGGGDSMDTGTKEKWDSFFAQIDAAIRGDIKFTMVLEDPLAASYVQSFAAPEPDERMKVSDYQRTKQEEEDLGLKDLKTEGYE